MRACLKAVSQDPGFLRFVILPTQLVTSKVTVGGEERTGGAHNLLTASSGEWLSSVPLVLLARLLTRLQPICTGGCNGGKDSGFLGSTSFLSHSDVEKIPNLPAYVSSLIKWYWYSVDMSYSLSEVQCRYQLYIYIDFYFPNIYIWIETSVSCICLCLGDVHFQYNDF